MSLCKRFILGMVIFLLGTKVFALENVTYQGYYVSSLITNTISLFEVHHLLPLYTDTSIRWHRYNREARDQQIHGMLPTFAFIDFEQSILNYCVVQKLITRSMAEIDLEKSKLCGGLQINGYNLLYLHAEIMMNLVTTRHITLAEAQNLFDSARGEK